MNFGSVGFIAWLSAGSELVVVYTASDNQQHRGAALLCRRGGTARTRAILTCVASLCPCDASAFRCSVSLCCWGGGQLQEDRIDNRQRRACLRVALLCRRGGTARTRAILTCVASLCPCGASAFRCSVSLCCWGGGGNYSCTNYFIDFTRTACGVSACRTMPC